MHGSDPIVCRVIPHVAFVASSLADSAKRFGKQRHMRLDASQQSTITHAVSKRDHDNKCCHIADHGRNQAVHYILAHSH